MNLESLRRFNAATTEAAVDQLRKCCGTAWWCEQMATRRPYESVQRLHAIANEVCDEMTDARWREAFACHPKIGDLESLRMKFAGDALLVS